MIYQDSMTGLENRNSFMEYCGDFSKRMPAPTGVLYMDIMPQAAQWYKRPSVWRHADHPGIRSDETEFSQCPEIPAQRDEFLIVSEGLTYEAFMMQMNRLEESLSDNGFCIISIGTTWNDIYTDLYESLLRQTGWCICENRSITGNSWRLRRKNAYAAGFDKRKFWIKRYLNFIFQLRLT